MRRKTWVIGASMIGCLLVSLAAGGASAQGLALDNPIPGQLVGGATAPTWLREGVRLSYESSFSAPAAKPGEAGTAGAGIMQIDIVAVTPEKVGATMTTWSKDLNGVLSFVSEVGLVGAPGGQSDGFWIHPAELAKVAEQHKDVKDVSVTIGPAQIGNQQFQVVRFQSETDKARTVSTFDKDTGILLMYLYGEKVGGTLQPRNQFQFVSMRERQLPWREGRPPQWLLKTGGLRYDGAMTTAIPGVPPMQQRATVTAQTTERGLNWVNMKLTFTLDGQPMGESVKVSGPTQTAGIWLPPLNLRDLQQGQVLDRDPLTGVTTGVMFVGQGRHGRQCVTIDEQGPAFRRVSEYETATGILLGLGFYNPALNQTTELYFTGIQ